MTAPAAERLTRPQAQREAARLRAEKWTGPQIRNHLANHGIDVSVGTVRRWATPADDEARRLADRTRRRHAYRRKAGVTRPLVADADGLWLRIQALDGAGLTAEMISRVIRLDHGIESTRYEIGRSIAEGNLTLRLSRRVHDA